MKKIICVFLCLLVSLASFAANKRFNTMVVFGDSLSDNGNLYRYMWHKIPLSPPYFNGRFSNGPVWIEQLYDSYKENNQLDDFLDFAVGGAGAILSPKGILPMNLSMELDNYLYWTNNGNKTNTLYTIWIGSNNYLNGPANIESITDSVVNIIGKSIERLITYGGNKFFVLNLPDLGRVPQAADRKIQPLLTKLTQTHNRKLALKINKLKVKYPKVIFVYFDVYSFFNQTIEHASDYGFSNVTNACFPGNYSGVLFKNKLDNASAFNYLQRLDERFDKKRWEMIKNNPQLMEAVSTGFIYDSLLPKNKPSALNCEGYLFWDHVHPTTTAHFYMAQKAHQLLDEAGLEAVGSTH